MILKPLNGNRENAGVGSAFKNACLASCRKILVQIATAKASIFSESYRALKAHEHLLRLALNEAEAVAAQTRYPHLLFPSLAAEKVQAVVAWDAHQREVRRAQSVFGLAE
jgi:hypothetical protein